MSTGGNTNDPYFGYTSADNTSLRQMQQMQHHLGEDLMHYPEADTSGLGTYTPTVNWNDKQYSDGKGNVKGKYAQQAGDDTIEKIYARIHGQNADQVDALNNQWFAVAMVLENISESLTNEATSLSQHWSGNAATAFLQRGPGAAAKSLYDWYSAALANSLGMFFLASVIREYQAKIDVMYEDYKKDMVSFSAQWTKDNQYYYGKYDENTGTYGDPKQGDPQQYLNDLRDHAETWNIKARNLQYQMSQEYWKVVTDNLNGGTSTIFEGPTDSIMPDQKLLLGFPNPGGMPNVGAPNVNAPNIGNPVNLPNLTVPNVNIPSTATSAPNVNMPNVNVPAVDPSAMPNVAPPDVTAPNVNVSPTNMPEVVAPNLSLTALNMTSNPATFTAQEMLSGQANAGAPNLGGLSKGLGMPPSTPRLSKGTLGRATPPGQGEAANRPPSAPNTLRNKSLRPGDERPLMPGEEEEFARPSGLNSSPPVLRGRSVGRPPAGFGDEGTGRTGAQLRRPGSPPDNVLNRKRRDDAERATGAPAGPVDETLFPGQPPRTAPVLRAGRPGPVDESRPAAKTLRGGGRRPAGATEPEMASRRKHVDALRAEEKVRIDQEFEKIHHLLSDEQAWTVSTPGGAVLDNTTEQRAHQVEPRPALGGGANG